MVQAAKQTGKRSKREEELVNVRHECFAFVVLVIICFVIGVLLVNVVMTEKRISGMHENPSAITGFEQPFVYDYEYYTYHPYWIPGGILIGLGGIILGFSLVKLILNENRLSRIRSGLSEKKERQKGARIPITESKRYGVLKGSILAIGVGVVCIFMAVFLWHHTMPKEIIWTTSTHNYVVAEDIRYPFRDLSSFFNVLGVVLMAIGFVGLYAILYLHYWKRSEKTIEE
jgi:hypothetical protein